MPEYPYQTWQRLFGKKWPSLAELAVIYKKAGINAPAGSYEGNIALQKKVIGGWDPYTAPAAPAATPAPKAKATTTTTKAATKASAVGPVPVQPGLSAEQFADTLALGEATLAEQIRAALAGEATSRRLEESQLAANPADFVAYELYKRFVKEQGFDPQSDPRSNAEIQDIFELALGLNEGTSIGTGRFGVDLPTTGSISRSELGGFSDSDIGILSSFLRGGVETGGGGEFQGINPADFFKELGEGLVPVIQGQRTQYRF